MQNKLGGTKSTMKEKIEKFYKKPQTHEELWENVKKLKEIPESKDHPKVIIKFDSPEEEEKFVYMEDTEGRKYVIALPIKKFEYHRYIKNFMNNLIQRETKNKVEIKKVIGGGWIKLRNDRLIIYGASGDFGEAPKEEVAKILKEAFPEIEVRAYPENIDKEVIEKNLHNREVLLEILTLDGSLLKEFPIELKNDREVVLEAVKQDGYALEYASEELKNDREVVLEAVKRNGNALKYASEELKNDREVVLEAVKRNGYALEYASEELKNDREVVLEAVKRNGYALEYASEELKNDREVVLEAVKQDGEALQYASEELQKDPEIQKLARGQK